MFPPCRHSVPTVTGVIYVVIIGLWAAVLIPIWLRRHDQISEVRSTARFSSAMKTLGGRGRPRYASGVDDQGAYYSTAAPTVSGGRSAAGQYDDTEARMRRGAPDQRAARSAWADDAGGLDPSYERELVRRAAATRRTMVLGTLTAILLVTLLLAIASVLPKWVPILAAVPVVAFVLATAMTASARAATSSRPSARVSARRESGRSTARRAERLDEAPAVVSAQADDWESWNAWDDDDAWDAVPTTLPTYVSAPRASAVPREIDRAHSGEWSGEAMVETARAMRSRPASEPVPSYADVDHSADTAEIPVVDYRDARAANQ